MVPRDTWCFARGTIVTPDAFTAYLEREYAGLVARTARVYHLRPADAEDVVQSTLLHFYERDIVPRLEASTLPRYLQRAIKMRVRDNARRAEVQERRLRTPLAADACIAKQRTPEPPAELGEAIERVLATIPTPSIRTTAWLIAVCGWDPHDAARTAGITLKHFKDRMREEGWREALRPFVRRKKRTRK